MTEIINHRAPSISFHRNQIWISELVGLSVVFAVVLSIGIPGTIIALNEKTIRHNVNELSLLSTEKITLEHRRLESKQKAIIAFSLNELTNNRFESKVVISLADIIVSNSSTYGYDPLLLLAVIQVESVFNPRALGQFRSGTLSGAIGLMQLKFETAREVAGDLGLTLNSMEDLLVPEVNIAIGAAYLTRLIARFKNLKLGILAYNQGPGTILEALKENKPISINYYNKVLSSYFLLKNRFAVN
jgi:soluble lytic murein transglycosylase